MSKVSITKSKLDTLANTISAKSGVAAPLTLDQMDAAVRSIPTGGATLIEKTITANGTYEAEDDDADGYSSVTVNVQSGTPRTSTDLVVSGATVTAPAGVYAQDASASVATGTAGTPTATKGTVSNHSVSITPSVTNTTGYITGGTNTGTAVMVSASELVSGTLSVDSSGTKDVTNYASVSVPAGTAGTPTATKGSVSNHAVSITPSVTNTAGYISGDTKTGTAVTVSASELVSGSETKTANGSYDVTNLAELIVNVSGSAAKTATGTFTGNGSRSVAITCAFEPDLVYWTSDPGTSASSGTVAGLIARGMMASNRYRNNSTTNSANIQTPITDMNTGGSSYNFRATYADGKVTIYCFSSNARSLFTNSRTYTYTFIKWTS